MAENQANELEELTNSDEDIRLTENELFDIFEHCFGPSFTPKTPWLFEYEEHRFLGDSIHLSGRDTPCDPNSVPKLKPFELKNGLELTYGEINGLAGDFFGTKKPIAQGADLRERKARFQEAFDTLAEGENNSIRVIKLLKQLKPEAETISEAGQKGISGSEAYATLRDETFLLDKITSEAGTAPSYIDLLKINLDHFGEDARRAYNAGHALAIEIASEGKDLELAYAMNAFADHFLQDSFASGHFRVPRKELMKGYLPNICANFMHNEDNELGLYVKSLSGKKWHAYGDKKLFDEKSKANLQQCRLALRTSVKEVYQAFENREVIDEKHFKAWDHAPTIPSLTWKKKNHAPLFKVINGKLHRRKDLKNPGNWEFTDSYHWLTTAYALAPPGRAQELIISWANTHGFSGLLEILKIK